MTVVFTITEIKCLMEGIFSDLIRPFLYSYLWYQVL